MSDITYRCSQYANFPLLPDVKLYIVSIWQGPECISACVRLGDVLTLPELMLFSARATFPSSFLHIKFGSYTIPKTALRQPILFTNWNRQSKALGFDSSILTD